jgi:hypothetical protein
MSSKHTDEYVIHVSIDAQPSRLYVSFSIKFDILLDRVDN